MKYTEFLNSLKIGDSVKAHYDGKSGRGMVGSVIDKKEDTIRVRFISWSDRRRVVEVDFVNGEGFDTNSDFMKNVIGVEEGDFYSLGPVTV